MNKFEIVKSGSQKYPYNARILTSVDGGENYYYCGMDDTAKRYKRLLNLSKARLWKNFTNNTKFKEETIWKVLLVK